MAIKGTESRLLVDEFDLSCETSQLVVSIEMSEEDVTTLCSTAYEYAAVLSSMSINQDGYMNEVDEDGSLEKELYTRLGVQDSVVCALLRTGLPQSVGYILDTTFGASMEITAPATSVITLNGTWGVGDSRHRGIRVFGGEETAVTTTGAQTAEAHTDPGTDGGEAYLFVHDVTGSLTTATIALQDSTTEGGTYANLGVFSVTDVGVYKITFSGAVNIWHRLNVTSMGGATSITMTCVSCVNGVSQ